MLLGTCVGVLALCVGCLHESFGGARKMRFRAWCFV